MKNRNAFISGLKEMELREIIAVYNSTQAILDKMQKLLSNSITTLEAYYDGFKLFNGADRLAIASGVKRRISSDYEKFLNLYLKLYNTFSSIFGAVYGTWDLKKELELKIDPTSVRVSASNTMFIVKLPHLPVKTFIRTPVFREILRTHANELFEKRAIPFIQEKLVRILHVYPTSANLRMIPDNDNYDIKNFVDLATDYTGGGDGGLHCSIFLETILSDQIAEGSYVIVAPKSEGVEPADKLIDKLKNDLNFQ